MDTEVTATAQVALRLPNAFPDDAATLVRDALSKGLSASAQRIDHGSDKGYVLRLKLRDGDASGLTKLQSVLSEAIRL